VDADLAGRVVLITGAARGIGAATARAFAGEGGRRLLVACAMLTTAATANAVLVVTSRVVFAMARDRLLPARLGAVHPATGAPWVAVLVNGLLLGAVAAAGSVRVAATAGGFLYVLCFIPPLAALVALRRRVDGARPAFRTPMPRVLLPFAFAASAALVVASGTTGLVLGSGWLLAGLVVHGVQVALRVRASAR
jgi:APA family basic amino acid/polyamine antiporter